LARKIGFFALAGLVTGLALLALVNPFGPGRIGPPTVTPRPPLLHLGATLPTLTPPPGAAQTEASLDGSGDRIGIIPGHWQFDVGATCDDDSGLQEVDVTLAVARQVQAALAGLGHAAELLPEHNPLQPQKPLLGYRGAALVSLHADSCVSGASGFKVARWEFASRPTDSDRLVECLVRGYADWSGLPRNDEAISADMRRYYAFREIHANTPAAIVELGFLADDRDALLGRQADLAQGIAAGLVCFLSGGD
jgi:N-acetylmuramoyl-L-alanine amidase